MGNVFKIDSLTIIFKNNFLYFRKKQKGEYV